MKKYLMVLICVIVLSGCSGLSKYLDGISYTDKARGVTVVCDDKECTYTKNGKVITAPIPDKDKGILENVKSN